MKELGIWMMIIFEFVYIKEYMLDEIKIFKWISTVYYIWKALLIRMKI